MGGVRDAIGRMRRSDAEHEAAQLQESSKGEGATAIDCCECGDIVTVCGPLRSVTINPTDGIPSVIAELYDGTGRVTLIWLGRREIGGIEPGRLLTATGRLTKAAEGLKIFNPRYTLRAQAVGE